MTTPSWKIPPGVARGTWDYVQSERIAADYDSFLAGHPLLELDLKFVEDHLPRPAEEQGSDRLRIADFGCGTGRVSRHFSPLGHSLVNVDLSESMLAELQKKTEHPDQNTLVHQNLAELDIPEDSIDLGVCLFSSYGMIRGKQHRLNFLRATKTALRPGGRLILHAHNRYQRLWDPKGPIWLLRSWLSSWGKKEEFGDDVYTYRGLPTMFLHIFSKDELRRELNESGFLNLSFYPLSPNSDCLAKPSQWNSLRAGGFLVLADV